MLAQSGKAVGRAAFPWILVLLTGASPTPGPGSSARDALGLVTEAARAWAPDASLVYLENDDTLGVDGRSRRWGYLFLSPGSERARIYSVLEGEIVLAEFLDFDFDAPVLPANWIDSRDALDAAEAKAGAKFRTESGGALGTALLVRGGLDEKHPDVTTWTVVYTATGQPSLFVVVDAASGKVLRTWRG